MTKTKWTPGPWRFYADTPSVDPNWHIVTTANRMRVLANIHIEPGNEVDQANAHLIAAAPELYEALAGLMSHQPDYADTLWQNALDALAKARGEQ